ncbi:MAG TPA: hypothetical protein VH643_21470 [Gemmataceae bacterium]
MRERSPFAENGRSAIWRWLSGSLAVGLVALALGVLIDAGPALGGTIAILSVAYLAALGLVMAGAWRAGRPRSGARASRPHHVLQAEGASHVP